MPRVRAIVDSRHGHAAAGWIEAPQEDDRDTRLVRLLDVLRYLEAAPKVHGLRVTVSASRIEQRTAQNLASRYGLEVEALDGDFWFSLSELTR